MKRLIGEITIILVLALTVAPPLRTAETIQDPTGTSDLSSIDSDRDGLSDAEDAVPNDIEINWPKTPGARYMWIEQVQDAADHGPPLAVNKHGLILFQALEQNSNPAYFDKVLWNSATREWVELAKQGSMETQIINSPSGDITAQVDSQAVQVVDLNDSGTIIGYGEQPEFYSSVCCSYPGMVWKKTANTFSTPYYFFADYPVNGFQQLWLNRGNSQLADDGTALAWVQPGARSQYVWKLHDTAAGGHGMEFIDAFSDSTMDYGLNSVLDKERALILEGENQGAVLPTIWLQEGTTRSLISSGSGNALAISLAPFPKNSGRGQSLEINIKNQKY